MLFNLNRQTVLALLKITAAVFILLAPSLLGFLAVGAEVYLVSAIVIVLFAARMKNEGKVSFSFNHLISGFLILYAVLSSLWANNREGQLIFIFALLGAIGFSSLASEYFEENSDGGISRRMMYMFSISGLLCAILNIAYWIKYIVPVAGTQALGCGLETPDFTAIFEGVCIIATVLLLKGSGKARKLFLIAATAIMAFVFIMAKSPAAWLFTIMIAVVFYLGNKEQFKKNFVAVSLLCAFVFTLMISFILRASTAGEAFGDVFAYGIKNIFGHGGGFWSGRHIFSYSDYSGTLGVGLLAYMFASVGIFGLLCCVCVTLRNIVLVIKSKSKESVMALLLTIAVMLLPFGENFTVILLWLGFNVYIEHLSGLNLKIQLKKQGVEKILYTLYVILIITVALFLISLVKMSADRAYSRKDYSTAANLYKTVANLNITDGYSCRMAVASMRKDDRIENNGDEAIRIVDRAIRRDSDNLENLREKALVYKECGEFELSAQQYREALQKAFVKDKYNLELAQILYKVVEKYPKGSSETKRAYEEIVSIAASTEDLDLRKEINDIADKAMGYTKGELSSEG